MKIVFLGWGSLIWDPRNLRIRKEKEWYSDGPFLPIEFARISKDKRLTLVLSPNVDRVQVLWAYTDINELEEAIENLRQREGTTKNRIGFVSINENKSYRQVVPQILNCIRDWAIKKSLDAVVWTDLPSDFKEKIGDDFTEENVIRYLENLEGDIKKKAEEYIRKAPVQVKTKMREIIERRLGWTYIGGST